MVVIRFIKYFDIISNNKDMQIELSPNPSLVILAFFKNYPSVKLQFKKGSTLALATLQTFLN